MNTLGMNLGETLSESISLYVTLPDGKQKQDIHDKILDISKMIDKLVDESLSQKMVEYQQATTALEKAVTDINNAKTDITKVTGAINSLAKAISAIGTLLAALGLVV